MNNNLNTVEIAEKALLNLSQPVNRGCIDASTSVGRFPAYEDKKHEYSRLDGMK